MPVGVTRSRVRVAVAQGRSLDWIDANLIEPLSYSAQVKAALYMEAFMLLPAAERERVVRENYAAALEQRAALN